jgi:thiamine transporter ThiT
MRTVAYRDIIKKVLHGFYISNGLAMAHWQQMGTIATEERITAGALPPPPAPSELPRGMDAATQVRVAPTVREVITSLVRHPVRNLFVRWNWKAALLSSLLRGTIFFCTNLISGFHAAIGAMLAEFALRATTSGFYGAITESLSAARPPWAATVAAMVLLPFLAHTLEFLVHWLRGTPKLGLSIATSVIFTAFSTAFNLFAMRRGVLITNGECKSLSHDLSRIPLLLLEFLLAGPKHIGRVVSRAFSRR